MYPSVRELPISEKRKQYIISHLIETFHDAALSRRVVNIRHSTIGEGFLRVGVNLIVDRIWFVDYVEKETYYSYEEIGWEEGRRIAFTETKMVIESILDKIGQERTISTATEMREEDLERAIAELKKSGFNCDAIITDVRGTLGFWHWGGFLGASNAKPRPFGYEGTYSRIPVYWSNFVPDKTTLLLNRNIGDLIVKQDIAVEISDIREGEVEDVMRSIPSLDKEKLREKIRIKADEVIKFDLKSLDAARIVKHSVG